MNKRRIDIRNKPAFWALAAMKLPGHMPNSNRQPANYSLAKTWLHRKACPPITTRAVGKAAEILGVRSQDIIRCLTGYDSITDARYNAWRAYHNAKRGDVNPDGTYNHTCSWCGRSMVREIGNGAPACSECKYGNQQYRRRIRVESGMGRAADHRRRALGAERATDETGWRRPGWHYAVMAEFGYACAYCGVSRAEHRRAHGVDLSIDHIIALAAGGKDSPKNMAPACRACNSGKRDRDVMEWASTKGIEPHQLVVSKYKALANG